MLSIPASVTGVRCRQTPPRNDLIWPSVRVISYAAGLITCGRLGDLPTYRRMFTLGMIGFTIASILCGLAQSPGQLVAARLLQGLTAAALVPQVLTVIPPPSPKTPGPGRWPGSGSPPDSAASAARSWAAC
jgi:MFS family permease